MAAGSEPSFRYASMSDPHPAWLQVAEENAKLEESVNQLYTLPVAELRKAYKPPPLPANAPVPGKDLDIRTSEVAVRDGHRVNVRIYQPLQLGKGHVLFFNLPGGEGFTAGTPETEETQNRLIATKNGAVVVSVEYRKAPECPCAYAVYDAMDVLLWCKEHAEDLGINPEKIILGGGGAGANISAVLALIARDEPIGGIIGQILNIPATCFPKYFPASRYEYHSYEQNANAPVLSAERMNLHWQYYNPLADPTPLASPLLCESHANLPPALIQVAGMDPLRDEGLAYEEALKNSGVKTTLKTYSGMPHGFYAYPDLEPSKEYFQTMVDWVDEITA